MTMPKSELELHIEGLDCANCALTLERSIAQLDGMERVQVSFADATLRAVGTLDPEAIAQRVEALGYRAVNQPPPALQRPDAQVAASSGLWRSIAAFLRYLWTDRPTAVALVAAVLLLVTARHEDFQLGLVAVAAKLLCHHLGLGEGELGAAGSDQDSRHDRETIARR